MLGMSNYIGTDERKFYMLLDEIKIIDKECQWKIRKISEAVYIKMSKKCISQIDPEFNLLWLNGNQRCKIKFCEGFANDF